MHVAGLSAVLSVALAAVAVATAHDPQSIEMEVLGVVPLENDAASLLVLRQKGEQTVLPIFVGHAEGVLIDQRLKHEGPPRGTASADLLEDTIEKLGGRVTRVEIDGASAAFSARVSLVQGGRQLDVEARPSDSIALALTARVPIFATRKVVATAGLTRQELSRPDRSHQRARGGHDDGVAKAADVQSF